jgi:hypothetical protein
MRPAPAQRRDAGKPPIALAAACPEHERVDVLARPRAPLHARDVDIKDVPLHQFDARLTLWGRSLASIVGMSEEPSRP